MSISSSDLLTLFSIGLVQLLAVMSRGPSFLITARTAVAWSRFDGVKVALFFGAGPVRAFCLRAKTWIDRVTGLFLGGLGLRLLWNAAFSA